MYVIWYDLRLTLALNKADLYGHTIVENDTISNIVTL